MSREASIPQESIPLSLLKLHNIVRRNKTHPLNNAYWKSIPGLFLWSYSPVLWDSTSLGLDWRWLSSLGSLAINPQRATGLHLSMPSAPWLARVVFWESSSGPCACGASPTQVTLFPPTQQLQLFDNEKPGVLMTPVQKELEILWGSIDSWTKPIPCWDKLKAWVSTKLKRRECR